MNTQTTPSSGPARPHRAVLIATFLLVLGAGPNSLYAIDSVGRSSNPPQSPTTPDSLAFLNLSTLPPVLSTPEPPSTVAERPAAPGDGAPGSHPAAEGTYRLSVSEALDLARRESPRLGQLDAYASAARETAREAHAGRAPSIDLSAGYTRLSNVPAYSIAPGPFAAPIVISPNLPDNWHSRLSVGVPLYTGGRLSGAVEAAERQARAASLDRLTGAMDLDLEAVSSYWSLVATRELERVLREGLASYEEHLKDAVNMEKLGLAPRNVVLDVMVQRDRAELNRLRATGASTVAEASLVRLLGLPAGAIVDPSEPLAAPTAPGGDPAAEDLESLIEEAGRARPERRALLERIGAAESRVRVERAARLPQASLGGGLDVANPNRRYFPPEEAWHRSWDVSVNLSMNLFDGGRVAAASARASDELTVARLQLTDLDRRIRLEVTSRFVDLRTARDAVEVAVKSLESAAESRRVSFERFRAGVSPSSELLDSENALLRAGLEKTDALANLRIASAALARAVGRAL